MSDDLEQYPFILLELRNGKYIKLAKNTYLGGDKTYREMIELSTADWVNIIVPADEVIEND